jgi:hypothetical protein
MPTECSELPKLFPYTRLKEHRGGLDDIIVHLKVKFSDSHTYAQQLVHGNKVRIIIVELGPLEGLMSI